MGGRLRCVLIVEDEDAVRRSIYNRVRGWATRVVEARSVAEARAALLEHPELIILDVRLPDGSGEEVAEAASQLTPRPMMVAMSGLASAAEGFRLAEAGVGAYVPKPILPGELEQAVARLRAAEHELSGSARSVLGRLAVDTAQQKLRVLMVQAAMERTGGNITKAADLLGVTRQAVQRCLREEGSSFGDRN